eukprot:118870-Pyramimonas_sp.AAC.2
MRRRGEGEDPEKTSTSSCGECSGPPPCDSDIWARRAGVPRPNTARRFEANATGLGGAARRPRSGGGKGLLLIRGGEWLGAGGRSAAKHGRHVPRMRLIPIVPGRRCCPTRHRTDASGE